MVLIAFQTLQNYRYISKNRDRQFVAALRPQTLSKLISPLKLANTFCSE